ncbi:MAG: hypothetical protein EWV53_18290 [Microcystis panniformis Mp_MB_F_20051200_S9]|uniref:Uncharacterized protein n=1 Tax=Microcystis panniformis Mp_MB_F_20051200_S9 TaxID=2486223 RepID=A0A552PP20_9CHRO|nr:MAG: hypothetical protein EWV43_20735 [Microcystis panniformis Mp_MB_F_20080800_S26D]TRV43645.1 MAG: hypothetical protein EWV87_20690 [Microcystis panniformis Mp_GB_SS_20050300_S99]TRV54947.1 MAG: hypothetical protein EWV42_02850 [Microcystis panniformis Mp_GB_SS_20050300_S99D]TRV55835.1 MAG: hypothetical protein EWV86_23590 [Microcystis panniformis Mp_MB_F_20051200_S9D]TRV58713.1 MAG: hypothetical protein EWV53_18290 [Microcystis panniformis Mp_MB_F_20051200_S9]TRV64329.1 MAG: hypothetical
MNRTINKLDHPLANIFIATDNNSTVDYSYGGTRMVSPSMNELEAQEVCIRLMQDGKYSGLGVDKERKISSGDKRDNRIQGVMDTGQSLTQES